MAEQLDMERRLIGEATSWMILKEMWTIAGNRKRALISIGLMACQQMTGTNTLVSELTMIKFTIYSHNLFIAEIELLRTSSIREPGSAGHEGLTFCYRSLRRCKFV